MFVLMRTPLPGSVQIYILLLVLWPGWRIPFSVIQRSSLKVGLLSWSSTVLFTTSSLSFEKKR